MKISALQEYLSDDLNESMVYARQLGLEYLEVRHLYGKRFPDFTRQEFAALKRALADNSLRVSACSPGLFSRPLSDGRWRKELAEILPLACERAAELGTRLLHIFSVGVEETDAEPPIPTQVIEIITEAADRASQAGFVLCIENHPGQHANTSRRLAGLLGACGRPNLGANWDPCNALMCGEEPFPTGFSFVADFVRNVHVKDGLAGSGTCVALGDGEVPWRAVISALKERGYGGFLCLEPGYKPRPYCVKECLERLKEYLT